MTRIVVGANMFVPLLRLGRLADAKRCLDDIARLVDDRDDYNRLRIDSFRGPCLRRWDAAGAMAVHVTSLERSRQVGFREGLRLILVELGMDLVQLNRGSAAAVYLSQGLEDAEDLGYPSLVRTALVGLGRAPALSGGPGEATDPFERAARLAEFHDDNYELARAHHGLTDAYRSRGDADAEQHHMQRAAPAYAECGVPEASLLRARAI